MRKKLLRLIDKVLSFLGIRWSPKKLEVVTDKVWEDTPTLDRFNELCEYPKGIRHKNYDTQQWGNPTNSPMMVDFGVIEEYNSKSQNHNGPSMMDLVSIDSSEFKRVDRMRELVSTSPSLYDRLIASRWGIRKERVTEPNNLLTWNELPEDVKNKLRSTPTTTNVGTLPELLLKSTISSGYKK